MYPVIAGTTNQQTFYQRSTKEKYIFIMDNVKDMGVDNSVLYRMSL
jgi:hypothetical protein